MNDSSPSRDAACAALRSAGEALGQATAPQHFFELLEHGAEAFELGVGVPFAPGAEAGLVLYYNPRARSEAYRQRALDALRQLGLDTGLVERTYEAIPVDRVGTVLAVEWSGRRPPSATIYFEEVSRFYDDAEALRATASLAALVKSQPPDETRRVGSLYIWALDLDATQSPALKLYRHAPASALHAVRTELCETVAASELSEWVDSALFSRSVGSDFIVQRRYGADGRVANHKVYRSFPYQRGGAGQSTPHLERLLAAASPGAQSLAVLRPFFATNEEAEPLFRPTNVALAFAPGNPQPTYGTAYWALWSNRPGRP